MVNLDEFYENTISFRPKREVLDSSCATTLFMAGKYKLRGQFINEAIQFYYDYKYNRRFFIINLIQNHYEFCKHALRKIGRSIKKANML